MTDQHDLTEQEIRTLIEEQIDTRFQILGAAIGDGCDVSYHVAHDQEHYKMDNLRGLYETMIRNRSEINVLYWLLQLFDSTKRRRMIKND